MNLPHLEPVRFVQNIKEIKDKFSIVYCKFPYPPSLAMICEAAAQSTASFSEEINNSSIGYLISLKNINLITSIKKNEYLIKINKEFTFSSMTEFYFEMKDEEKVYASGNLTIIIKNDNSHFH